MDQANSRARTTLNFRIKAQVTFDTTSLDALHLGCIDKRAPVINDLARMNVKWLLFSHLSIVACAEVRLVGCECFYSRSLSAETCM